MCDWDSVFHDCPWVGNRRDSFVFRSSPHVIFFNQQRFGPDASRAILVRAFGGSNCMLWFFDPRKLVYFRRLEGDLGMCRLNFRAVFLPTGFARLGWGSVFYLPKPARPTGLRKCLLFFSWGRWRADIRYMVFFLHLYFVDHQNCDSPHNTVLYDLWWKHLRTGVTAQLFFVCDFFVLLTKIWCTCKLMRTWVELFFCNSDSFCDVNWTIFVPWWHHKKFILCADLRLPSCVL